MRAAFSLILLSVALVSLPACGKDSSPTSSSGDGVTVSIVSGSSTLTTNAYSPNPVSVQRGGTVTWVNNDATSHTSTSDATGWNSGTMAPGGRFSMTFPTAGSFPYHCTLHPGMVGTVNVQ
jgi:plastocyanin